MTLKVKLNGEYQSEEVAKEMITTILSTYEEPVKEMFINYVTDESFKDASMELDINYNDDDSVDMTGILHVTFYPNENL